PVASPGWAAADASLVMSGTLGSRFGRGVRGDEVRVDPDDTAPRRAAGGAERLVPAGQRLGEEPGVVGQERVLVAGQVILVIDRLDRAHRFARPAVHALVGMDVERASA